VLAAADRLTAGRTRFMCFRTRVLDDAVRAAAAEGFDQLVILGAGLDARAWRLGAAVAGMSVFEVDHPDTQALKRTRMAERRPHAASVRFVGVDFEHDRLDERLLHAGFDPHRRALVLWEGVVMYLVPEAIDATLSTLHGVLPVGSRVAVSYSRTGTGRGRLLRQAVGLVVAAAGETFRHHEEPAAMAARAGRAGFAVTWDEGHPDWSPRYRQRAQPWDIQRIVMLENQ
jgi:methyltransferase (TIGR00027 family)